MVKARSEFEAGNYSGLSLCICLCSRTTAETLAKKRRCIQIVIRTLLLISLYFCTSIGLTFYQKWLLKTFHFPLSVVICHLVVKFVLASWFRCMTHCRKEQNAVLLPWQDFFKKIAPVGVTSALDIGLSNWSFEFITVSLYTMTKSTAIIFIAGFALFFKLEKKHWSLFVVAAMISGGLFMFTFHATQFRWEGFAMVLTASFLSGLRWTLSQLVMQRSEMGLSNPVDMIFHIQPWMILTLLPFAVFFEGVRLSTAINIFRYEEAGAMLFQVGKVLAGAVLAFLMEVSEYLVVSYASSLTLAVSGIVKEIVTLAIAISVNGDQISFLNAIGLAVCLMGITIHVITKAQTIKLTEARSIDGILVQQKLEENIIVMSPLLSASDESDSEDDEKRKRLEEDTEYILFQRDKDIGT